MITHRNHKIDSSMSYDGPHYPHLNYFLTLPGQGTRVFAFLGDAQKAIDTYVERRSLTRARKMLQYGRQCRIAEMQYADDFLLRCAY